MLNKKQIIKRLETLLTYEGTANGYWYCDEIRSLIISANSPEKFE